MGTGPTGSPLVMAVLTHVFRHDFQLVGAGTVSWGKPVKVRWGYIAAVTFVVLHLPFWLLGINPGGIVTLFINFILPVMVPILVSKRLKWMQERTPARWLGARLYNLLAPAQLHGLSAVLGGWIASARGFILGVFEYFLPHSAHQLRLMYAEGNLVFTHDGDVYMGFTMEPSADNAMSDLQKVLEARRRIGLYRERARNGSGLEQIKVYKPRLDVDGFISQAEELVQSPSSALRKRRTDDTPSQSRSWERTVAAQADMLRDQDFRPRRIIWFQHLGKRQAKPADTIRESVRRFIERVHISLGFQDEIPPRAEIEYWRNQGLRTIGAFKRFGAKPSTTDDLQDVLLHEVWRGFSPKRLPSGPNRSQLTGRDFRRLANGPVSLKTVGDESTYDVRVHGSRKSYTAHLALQLPAGLSYGVENEWAYAPEVVGAAMSGRQVHVDVTAHNRYFDKHEGAQLLRKQLARLESNIRHFEEFGEPVPDEWILSVTAAREVVGPIASGQDVLISSEIILTLSGESPEEVDDMLSELRELMNASHIDLEQPTDLQPRLRASILPCNRALVTDYEQWFNAGAMTASGLTSSLRLGERKGYYFAHFTRGGDAPVLADWRAARRRNKPGGVALIGSQGSGKSETGKLIGTDLAKQNVPGVILDFKAQETSRLAVLPDVDVGFWTLNVDDIGQLDPYQQYDRGAARPAFEAFETILERRLTRDDKRLLRAACLAADELREGRSSLRVLELLKKERDARNLVADLEAMREFHLAKLFFAEGDVRMAREIPQLLVAQIQDLVLPEEGVAEERYTSVNWLSLAAVQGLGHRIKSLARHAELEDLYVFFDETHVLEKTNIGNTLVEDSSRYSRFLGMIPVIGSQGTREIARYGKHFPIRMVFRITDDEEAGEALKFVGWGDTPSNRQLVMQLDDGECIMRDLDGRTGVIQIIRSLEEYPAAFDTTHTDKKWREEFGELVTVLQQEQARELVAA